MTKNRLLSLCLVCFMQALGALASNVVTNEGAWCWFADPRALHYENAAGTINATYLGYIDVHGNVMATQYDWLTHRKTDVLIRSYFQPDDHNNPTFVVLPDERVMIFYTRHTDEAKIWYRISRKPGDITALGEEKYLATANNTTYPSPFIMSDDPQHVYLCWRGINWHPTLARITMPDADDNCQFDFGPKQIVQSTGARPYAKYASNGKDKIYVSYTTGHPDNEMPNWLYFNVIDINEGNGPILRDLNGKQLKVISDGPFLLRQPVPRYHRRQDGRHTQLGVADSTRQRRASRHCLSAYRRCEDLAHLLVCPLERLFMEEHLGAVCRSRLPPELEPDRALLFGRHGPRP